MNGSLGADGLKLRRTKARALLAVPRGTVNFESTAARFRVPKELKLVPFVENSTPTFEVPTKVRAPRVSTQSLPVRPAGLRSTLNTTLAAALATIASDSVETCPSDARTVNASKSRRVGASRFEASEPSTAALGRNSSMPLPAFTGVEPNWPSTYIVP